jgi:hypothetical protein
MLTGKEHGRTIPLADLAGAALRTARRASAPRRGRSKHVVERVRLRSRTQAAGSPLIAQAAGRACERGQVLRVGIRWDDRRNTKSPVAGIEIDWLLEPCKQRKERRERSHPHIRDGDAVADGSTLAALAQARAAEKRRPVRRHNRSCGVSRQRDRSDVYASLIGRAAFPSRNFRR